MRIDGKTDEKVVCGESDRDKRRKKRKYEEIMCDRLRKIGFVFENDSFCKSAKNIIYKTIMKWYNKKDMTVDKLSSVFEVLCYASDKMVNGSVRKNEVEKEELLMRKSILMDYFITAYEFYDEELKKFAVWRRPEVVQMRTYLNALFG